MNPLDNLPEIKQRVQGWWNRTNTGPVSYMIFERDPIPYDKLRKPWMSPDSLDGWSNWKQEIVFGHAVQLTHQTGDWQYVEDAIDLLAEYPTYTGYAGEGYSFNLPMLGPGSLSAYLSGFMKYFPPTIWLDLVEPWSWKRVLALTETSRDPLWDTALQAVRRHVARLQKLYVIAHPDHGGILDVLASLVGTQELLMKMIEEPEETLDVIGVLEMLWYKADAEFGAIIDPGNHGCYVRQMRWVSAKPVLTAICDLCAMIGPEMFDRFVLPSITRDCGKFDGNVIYHLDGPGQLPHVDSLLKIEKLRAIQWVEGAGNPPATDERWHGLYHKIIDAGKGICISESYERMDAMRSLFAKFPSENFYVGFWADQSQAAEAAAALRKFAK